MEEIRNDDGASTRATGGGVSGRKPRDEDDAFRRAVTTVGYFAIFVFLGNPADRATPLEDVVGLGVLVGLAAYFDRPYLRMLLGVITCVGGLALGFTGALPD